MECVDSSGAQVHPDIALDEFLAIDRSRIHALTGPIFVEGANPGDVLQVEVLEVAHKGWGWSSVIGGLGFLKERFKGPFLFQWKLDGEVSRSLVPAVVPLRPFCGVMGVARAEDGEFVTRPPGPFGGNMDVRELCSGATLYLPVFNSGALFSAGDAHAAQGDGEVCINGIECPADVTLRFTVHKGVPLAGPLIETPAPRTQDSDQGSWIVVESATDAAAAGAWRDIAHGRFARPALGLQRASRLSAMQRGHEPAPEPGGERADVHRFRRDFQARPASKEPVLTLIF